MHVDIEHMRSGADRSYRASDLAKDAADALARTTVRSGIFGSFTAAEDFHTAMVETHSNHKESLDRHHGCLGVIGDKSHRTASLFEEMEQRNAAALRALT